MKVSNAQQAKRCFEQLRRPLNQFGAPAGEQILSNVMLTTQLGRSLPALESLQRKLGLELSVVRLHHHDPSYARQFTRLAFACLQDMGFTTELLLYPDYDIIATSQRQFYVVNYDYI